MGAAVSGVTAGLVTTFSVDNVSGFLGASNGVMASAALDLTFGTGLNVFGATVTTVSVGLGKSTTRQETVYDTRGYKSAKDRDVYWRTK